MKIAIVTETFAPNTDGIVTRLCATIDWLKKKGHHVFVIAPDLGIDSYKGTSVAGLPARTFFLYREKKLALPTRKVGQLLRDYDPDIVHVVNPAVLGVAGIYYTKKLGLPLIASYHTNIPQYADYYRLPFLKPALWGYLRMLHNRADMNLCTSQSVYEQLTSKRFRHVHVWKRGVDLEMFAPEQYDEDMRMRLTNQQPDQKLLLYVGRLAAEKEIEKLRHVLETSPEFCLAIVGDGPYRSHLEKHFAGTNTVFTGFLHGKQLASAYASADLFVFPSTTETLGLVILEAMASGLPVIAADSGPTREQIKHGHNGLLFDQNDPESLTKTVLTLADDERRKQMSVNALKTGQLFGWSKPSEQLLHFYMQTIQHHRETGDNVPIDMRDSS